MRRAPGYWRNEENVLRALSDYISLFEGRADLRQKHFLAHRVEHGWPNLDAIAQFAAFQEMLNRARKWHNAQLENAA